MLFETRKYRFTFELKPDLRSDYTILQNSCQGLMVVLDPLDQLISTMDFPAVLIDWFP